MMNLRPTCVEGFGLILNLKHEKIIYNATIVPLLQLQLPVAVSTSFNRTREWRMHIGAPHFGSSHGKIAIQIT